MQTSATQRARSKVLAVCLLFTYILLAMGVGSQHAWSQIDFVDTWETQQQCVVDFGDPNPSFGSVSGPGILGDERDIFCDILNPNPPPNPLPGFGVRTLINALGQTLLIINTDATVLDFNRLTWDGSDNDAQTLDHTGLGSLDLTSSGTRDAFRLNIVSLDVDRSYALAVQHAL